MNDVIELELITSGEAECLHKMQVEAFIALYEKYRDDITSPAKESLEKITQKIVEDNSDFYFILFNGKRVGGARVKWHNGRNVKWISPIFVIPQFQNKGIASAVIEQLFEMYSSDTIEWRILLSRKKKIAIYMKNVDLSE